MKKENDEFKNVPVIYYSDEMEERRLLSEIRWSLKESPLVIIMKREAMDSKDDNEIIGILDSIKIASKLQYIKRTLFVTWAELALIIGVKERTLMKWKKGEIVPRERYYYRIEALYDISKTLMLLFPDSGARRKYLYSMESSLKDTPINALKKDKHDRVMKRLEQLQEQGY